MEKPCPEHLEQVARAGGGEAGFGFELIVPLSSEAFLSFNSTLAEVDNIMDIAVNHTAAQIHTGIRSLKELGNGHHSFPYSLVLLLHYLRNKTMLQLKIQTRS